MEFDSYITKYKSELIQISESIHRKHFDLDLNHIYQLSISSLFDVIKDQVKKESIPGALYNKTYAAVLAEKGALNESDKNSHREFLQSVKMHVLQPEEDELETIWKLFFEAQLTEKEIFILLISEGIHFDREDYKNWTTEIKHLMEGAYKERKGRGIINWTMGQIATKLNSKLPLVFKTKKQAMEKLRKLVYGNRHI